MSYDYDFEVDNVEDDDVFIITSTSKKRRIIIQGYDIYIL